MEENPEQLVIEQKTRISQLEKIIKKNEREIYRLQNTIEKEKIYANIKANQMIVHTIAQRERDRYLQLLLSNSPNIIMCFDHTEHIVFFSDVFLKLSGKTEKSVSGRQLKEILDGFCGKEIISSLIDNLHTVISTNKPCSVSVEIGLKNDDKNRIYFINIIPMTSNQADNEGAMAIFHDITDIENSREEAERANAAKSEFLSNMSHEIRTPLNAITGMAAIANNSNSIERKNHCLKEIDRATIHLLRIINDIFDMSKMETNKLTLSMEIFEFEKMIQKIETAVKIKTYEKKQVFSYDLDKTIPQILVGDEQRLFQIIMNLLSNSVKFTPEGGTISLSAHLAEMENDICFIQIEISDTGIGISPEQQTRLFTPFQQIDSSMSRRYGGTGLGLAISKSLVKLMGGNIWIKSELGKGATFAFTFTARSKIK